MRRPFISPARLRDKAKPSPSDPGAIAAVQVGIREKVADDLTPPERIRPDFL
ncbi:MAG: hypothetical protein U9N84_07435 [Actinomycetota bacterium]|nr:hypothetical protein [Actinomycetota bacterium]